MEPRPGPPRTEEIPGAPLQVGDFVSYCGPTSAYERRSPDYRVGGVVLWIRPLCPSAPCDCDWRVGVDWPQSPGARYNQRNHHGNYHAKNLRLVRKAPIPGVGWPQELGDLSVPLRAEEV